MIALKNYSRIPPLLRANRALVHMVRTQQMVAKKTAERRQRGLPVVREGRLPTIPLHPPGGSIESRVATLQLSHDRTNNARFTSRPGRTPLLDHSVGSKHPHIHPHRDRRRT